jgi:hypothetical protein
VEWESDISDVGGGGRTQWWVSVAYLTACISALYDAPLLAGVRYQSGCNGESIGCCQSNVLSSEYFRHVSQMFMEEVACLVGSD